jgi:hypothetical protein
MSQKRVKRRVEWTIKNVTRETLKPDYEVCSKIFNLKLGDNDTAW